MGAYRELAEETGIRLDDGLELFGQFTVHHAHTDSDDEFRLFVMGTDLTDDDVECHEGRQIVFVDPRPGGRARPHSGGRDRAAAVHRLRALPPDPEHPGVHARRGRNA